MSLKLRIYYNAIFGAIGGLLSWFLLGCLSAIANYHLLIRDVISGGLIGIFIGIAVSLADGVFSRSAKRAVTVGYYGAFSGAIGGAVGLLVGEVALFALSGGILGRAFGWLFIGLAVGTSEGIANRAPRKSSYGGIGGAVGGFIGGAVFESLRQVSSSYLLSQALGMVILGGCIGSLIAVVQDIMKQAKIKVLKGRQEGREYPIFQERATIGRDERCDIGLFGTPGVALRHAEIRRERDNFLIYDLGESSDGVWVNRQKLTQGHPLTHGDKIQMGEAELLFLTKKQSGNPAIKPSSHLALMLLCLIALMLIFMSPCELQAEGWQAQLSQIEKADFPQVILYVGVTDSHDKPITTLQQQHFEIAEDGVRVPIDHFIGATTEQPLTIALVIDKSTSMTAEGKLEGAKQAAIVFVRLMKAVDSTSLFAFSHQTENIQGLTTDKDLLTRQIEQITAAGGTACYDAVYKALESLKAHRGRKAVIALTDGMDNKSRRSADQTCQFAQEINTPVYTIGLGSKDTSSPNERQIDETALKKLATETGGRYFYAPSADKLTELYRLISTQLQYGYVLAYQTPRPIQDGTERHVTVDVNHTGELKSTTAVYYIPGVIVPQSNFALFLILLVPLICLLFLPVGIRYLQRLAHHKAPPRPLGGLKDNPPLPPAGGGGGQPRPTPAISPVTQQIQARLVADGRHTSPATFAITQTRITIGRHPDNDLVISHPSVSNRHAEIRWENDRYVVEDKNSTNGTYVSFQGQPEQLRRITKNALRDGSLIRFGGVSYFLRMGP